MNLFLNELFSFVNLFRKYHFVHGNLSIDNVFLDKLLFETDVKFVVLDYSNSFLQKKPDQQPLYKRSSFVGVLDVNKDKSSKYWDFFTMYVSLKLYFQNIKQTVEYLEELILNYIPSDTLDELLYKYISTVKL